MFIILKHWLVLARQTYYVTQIGSTFTWLNGWGQVVKNVLKWLNSVNKKQFEVKATQKILSQSSQFNNEESFTQKVVGFQSFPIS